MQVAVSVPCSKIDGSLNVASLDAYLAQGWKVISTESSGVGDILVILEKLDKADEPKTE